MNRRAMPVLAACCAALLPASAGAADTPAEVLSSHFDGVLQAMQRTGPPSVGMTAAGGTVGATPGHRVVWSSEPLVVDGEPVQRAVEHHGDHLSPTNPLVDVQLPVDPGAAMVVGSGTAAYTVTAIGADNGAEQVVGDGVLHPGTHPETDTVARAVSGGAETYELIRGAAAPEQFTYRIGGAVPRAAANGQVELVDGGKVVGTVTAPVIADAALRPVRATLSVRGSDVVFTVEHRAPGVQYPVLADPQWTADYNFAVAGQGNGGLYFQDATDAYDKAGVTGGPRPGITIQPLGGRAYTSSDIARVFFAAPPGSTIDRVDFQNVYRRNNFDRQTARLALYGPTTDIVDDWASNTALTQASVPLDDPNDAAKFAMVWMGTPPCGPSELNCPRQIDAVNSTRVTVGRMLVTLVDPGAPTITMSGGLTSLAGRWVRGEGLRDLTVNFTDDGSGLKQWQVDQTNGGASVPFSDPYPVVEDCDTRHSDPANEAFPCPQSDTFTDSDVDLGQLAEGHTRIVPSAVDFANNPNSGAASSLELWIDRSAPSVDRIYGALTAASTNRWQQLRGSQPLLLDLSDQYSGVKDAEVNVTPISPAGTAELNTLEPCTPEGAPAQPCPTSTTQQLDVDTDAMPDGELEVSAIAHDYLGYASAPVARRFFKDNTAPAATAKGELAELEGEWTGSTGNTDVTLQGKDRRSGVARLELFARDDQGRRLVDDIAVCDPAGVDASAGETCPQQVSRTASVDLGDLESGKVTLEAYATDAAGNRDPSPDSWDTYVDHDPPSEPGRVKAITGPGRTVQVSWAASVDDGSGLAGYEYRLKTDDRTTEWVTTPFPAATLSDELQRPILDDPNAKIEVRGRDRTGNRGPSTSGELPDLVATQYAAGGGELKCPTSVRPDHHNGYALSFGRTDRMTDEVTDLMSCLKKMNKGSVVARVIVPIDLFGLSKDAYKEDGAQTGDHPKTGNFAGLADLPSNVALYVSFMPHSFDKTCKPKEVTLAAMQSGKQDTRPFLPPCGYPDNALYAKYVQQFKRQLKDANVTAWSAWNEPNNPMFTLKSLGAQRGGAIAAGYWKQLRKAGLGDTIVAGEIDATGASPAAWADAIRTNMGKKADVWAVHDYPSTVYGKRTAVTKHIAGFGGELWITEMGFQYHKYKNGGLPPASTQAARAKVYTDAGQGKGTIGTVSNVTRVFYYGVDPASFLPGDKSKVSWDTGLWDRSDTPRPVLCGIYRATVKSCAGKGL